MLRHNRSASPELLLAWHWPRMKKAGLVLLLGALLFAVIFSAQATVTAQDDAGNLIKLPQPAQRIVTLAPHTLELVCAAGGCARVVGKGSHSYYPSMARMIPEVGDNRQMDVERIIALRPDLLVLWRYGVSQRQLEQIRQFGISVFVSDPHRMSDIADNVVRLGKLLGTQSVAHKEALRWQGKIQALKQRYARRKRVRVFYQISDRPLYTLNGSHIVSEGIRLCGGENVFADLKTIAPQISVEAVLQADPDTILHTSVDEQSEGLSFWQRYPALKAVENHHLYSLNPDLLDRPGPRFIDGVETMCDVIDRARKP